ncbi:MAG TPA: hypothetical protein VIU37_09945 [Candidatus Limnocylindrales bacterium]
MSEPADPWPTSTCTCTPGMLPTRSCPVHGDRPTRAGIASELRRVAAQMTALADRVDPPPTRPEPPDLPDVSPGSVLVAAERLRQIDEEGHDPDHDAAHRGNELAWGAYAYLERAAQDRLPQDDPSVPHIWPWPRREWKPKGTRVRNLVIAAALVVAEIDRRLREGEKA